VEASGAAPIVYLTTYTLRISTDRVKSAECPTNVKEVVARFGLLRGPSNPRLVDIIVPPLDLWWQHRHLLPPQCRRLRQCASLLLPRGVRIKSIDQFAYLSDLVPTPALHTKDRHHACDPCSEQRQRIKGALAYPQRTNARLQIACCAGAQYGTECGRRYFITAGECPSATLMLQQAHGPAPE
jgi:hypothetical protein